MMMGGSEYCYSTIINEETSLAKDEARINVISINKNTTGSALSGVTERPSPHLFGALPPRWLT